MHKYCLLSFDPYSNNALLLYIKYICYHATLIYKKFTKNADMEQMYLTLKL